MLTDPQSEPHEASLAVESLVRPNVGAVRAQMPAEGKQRSTLTALRLFLVATLLYAGCFVGVVLSPWWPLQIVFSVLLGVLICVLFVIGHDACHGSLTRFEWLNQVLGRLAFLPSLHPYIAWEFGHNRVHHAWTNLRGKDYAWAPFSKAEYDALPRLRRGLERVYRTFYGLGLYYLIEYWWKHMLFPSRAERGQMGMPWTLRFDRLLALAFFGLQIGGLAAYWAFLPADPSGRVGVSTLAGWIVWGVVFPFGLWNWLMGFAIFQHHNHPSVAWYADRQEWDFYRGQVQGTVHVVLPWGLGRVFHNIMEHTAHHANPRIPLYNLTACQNSLEQAFPEDIAVEVWTLKGFLQTLGKCKLYDYTEHRWLTFAGRPTSWPIHQRA